MKRNGLLFACIILVLILTACQPAPSQQTNTPLPPKPTNTPLPTNTPVPTNTSTPTKTPVPPTATVPAPEKVSEYLENVQVIVLDSFDKNTNNWELSAGRIQNGVLEILGKDWNGLGHKGTLVEGEGIILDFTYTKGSVFEMFVDKGQWWTDPYRRFGVYMDNNNPRVNVWTGKTGFGGYLSGNFRPKPDTQYSLLLVVLPKGEFLSVIWDPADPSQTIYYRENIGETWSNIQWNFRIGADKGTILFDNYREIIFDTVK